MMVARGSQAEVDILLVASKDWQSISVQHAWMLTFWAIEDGYGRCAR
jgi:hypothetical protein